MNINILGISELNWTGMGEFNSDNHYIYSCGQKSLRRNGVALIVNIVKTIPKKKKCKKAKWLSEEALQIAEKRREVTGKGEKERYIHLNAEFQRIARRDKKAFLSEQRKETEENERMGKTRDLFKKIRDTKGTFHAKMDTIKDRNGMDLAEAEDIKKRWQEYTKSIQKYTRTIPKKILMTQVRTKLVDVMEFQLSYFKS